MVALNEQPIVGFRNRFVGSVITASKKVAGWLAFVPMPILFR
jgi:hypothetical protein